MKRKIIIALKCIFFIITVIVILYGATIALRRKDSLYKYADFFELAKKDQIDVLFLGSSHTINAVNPAVLYNNYGYTSYNMGGHGSLLQATYWELMEALQYETPEWVVVDAYMLEKNYRYLDDRENNPDVSEINTSIEQLHLNMDVWPLNKLKVEAMNDLVLDKDLKREFLFDFIVYHNRWEYITEDDFKSIVGNESRNELFGAEMRYDVDTTPYICQRPEDGEVFADETVGMQYLSKIIEECQDRKIGILVTFNPFNPETKDIVAANTAGAICNAYGVPYLNMLDGDVIDIYSDLNDRGHLNVTGADKTTRAIGDWLKANAGLVDHRDVEAYAYWEKLSNKYYDELRDKILSEDSLFTKLKALSIGEYGFVLYCNEGSQVFTDEVMKHLIKEISGSNVIYETPIGPYIMICDPGFNKVYEASGDAALDNVETAMGFMNYRPVEKNFRLFYETDDEETNYLYDEDHVAEDVQLLIYDKNTGEVIDHEYYTSKGGNYGK